MPSPTPLSRLRNVLDRASGCLILVIIGLSPLHASRLAAQSTMAPPALSDSAMQALYLFNFAKFIEWPAKALPEKETPIRLCIYGEKPSEIRQSIGSVEGKTVQGRELAIRRNATLTELNDCQIVFVPGSEERWLSEVLRVAHAASALTVSDMEDFVESGGGVGLFMVDHQIRFEFNLGATHAAQLKISSQLLKLAKAVKGQ
jgi:hypothetical protein